MAFDAATATLRVRDSAESRQAHRLEQFWHFAPGLRVTLEHDRLRVEGERFVLTAQFQGAALRCALFEGQSTPPLGWYSSRYEEKSPCSVLRVATERSDVPLEACFTITRLT